MKTATNLRLLGVIACCLIGSMMYAQTPELDVQTTQATVALQEEGAQSYQIDIAGPNNYHVTYKVEDANSLQISPLKEDGTAFGDGVYTVAVTPSFRLTEEHQAAMAEFRQRADQEGMAAYIAENNIPTGLEIITYHFGIRDGKFVSPNKHEGAMPPPTMSGYQADFFASETIYASVNYFEVETPAQTMDLTLEEEMQVFTQDVIIQGSLCVGVDCPSSQTFGFDTQILKENNLRLFFDDTSNSASFPANDWRLAANGTNNGDPSFFAIQDATANRTPFQIAAGAPNNALFVDANGDIGIGIPDATVEVHVRDGDSPTLRLEQDGSNGFASQTWDLAGNETNFFVRDVNGGSALPFRIFPGNSNDDQLVIRNSRIGVGTDNPSEELHIKAGNVQIEQGNLDITAGNMTMTGNMDMTGRQTVRGDARFFLDNRANFVNSAGTTTIMQINAATNRVGIGKTNPDHLLELAADDAVKPNGGSWSAPSDRRLKTNIQDYEDGLAKVMAIRPVRYHYNGKLDMPTDKEFIGLIAQEIREVAPYTVRSIEKGENEEGYLFVDGTPLTYMLINAVQDQQEIINAQEDRIEQLEAQLDEVAQLRQEVSALAKLLEAKATEQSANATQNAVSRDRK